MNAPLRPPQAVLRFSSVIALLFAAIFTGAPALGQTIVAAATDTGTSSRRSLSPRETQRSFDGATATVFVFEGGTKSFDYTSPSGWKATPGGGNVSLAKGNITASIEITILDNASDSNANLSPTERIKSFLEETAAKVSHANPSDVTATILPIRIGDQIVAESTVNYERGGKVYALQRIKSWGDNWRTEVQLNGPKEELLAAEASLLQSLCSIRVRTDQDHQLEARVKENEILARIARENEAVSSARAAGKVRGRLP